jgi:peptide/nickel transport system ATP-binding protein
VTAPISLLRVENMKVEFRQRFGQPVLRAVNGVSFEVHAGETVGLVGESGSGKSTISRAVLGLTPINNGKVIFNGRDITRASRSERRQLSEYLSVVFQDPYSSLNPTRTIGQTLAEPLLVHRKLTRDEVDKRVTEALARVGLGAEVAARYPRNFSGGQRQRIAIARALILEPKLVICDEAVSALDLSIQAQVLNLLKDLQVDLGLSYLFIAHDLSVVRFMSHSIVVIYRGEVMESGPASTVYSAPKHPYTRSLLDSIPAPDPRIQHARRTARQLQSSTDIVRGAPSVGCPYARRCAFAVEVCVTDTPLLQTTEDGSTVACHRYPELFGSEASPVVGDLGTAESPRAPATPAPAP